MNQIEAIFQGGVFKPLNPVDLPDNQRVRLNVQRLGEGDVAGWLEQVRQMQQQVVDRQGYFPDSTPDIAADRLRDE